MATTGQYRSAGAQSAPKGAWAQAAHAVFRPLQLKNGNFSQTIFCFLTIHNDQISHVKHALDPLYVVFTLFRCWRGASE